MKRAILEALEARYNAQIAEADATIKIYLENSVGIGEHPQHIDEVDKLITKIAELADSLNVTYDKLISIKLTRNLAPLGELQVFKI